MSKTTLWPLLLGLGLLGTEAQVQANEIIKLGYQRGGGVFPIAQERGILEQNLREEGISIAWSGPFDRCATLLQAIISDEVDIGGCGDIPTFSALAAGQPICIARVTPPNPDDEARRNVQVIIVPGDSPIQSIPDLVGKKVAINTGGAGEYLLLKALEVNGIPSDQVERINISPPDALPALLTGAIDAWAVWEPYNTIAELEHGARRIPVDLPPLSYSIMVASQKRADQSPEAFDATFQQLDQEIDWMFEHPQESAQFMVNQLKISLPVAERVIELRGTYAGNIIEPDPEDLARMQATADWMLENKLIIERLDVASKVCP